jgi:hypothetical protein
VQSRGTTRQTTPSMVVASGIRDQAFTPFAAQEVFGAGIAHAAPENIADSYYDPETGQYVAYKRRQSRIPLLNLLDHEGIVLNHRVGIAGIIGIASIIHSLLMGGIMGLMFAGIGGVSTILTSLNLGNSPLMNILQETQKWLQYAQQQGIPVDQIAAKMRGQMVSHLRPKRLANYALLTVLGRGAGSFWLGTVCTGLSVFAVPDLLTKGTYLLSGLVFFKKSFEDSAVDIFNYKMTHDPAMIEKRIGLVVKEFMVMEERRNASKKAVWAQEKQAVKQVVQTKGLELIRNNLNALPPEQQHLADALMNVMARRMNGTVDSHTTPDQQVAQVAQAVLTRVPVAKVSEAVLQQIKNTGVVPADVSKLLEVKAKMAALKVPDLANVAKAPQNVQQAANALLLSQQENISFEGGIGAVAGAFPLPPFKMEIPPEMREAMKGFANNAQEAFTR